MKNKIQALAVAALILAFVPPALAEKAEVKVNGMVCAFCAQGIKKKFSQNPSVESSDVNLETKMVTLTFKKGKKMSDDEIRKAIKDAGYNVESLKRSE